MICTLCMFMNSLPCIFTMITSPPVHHACLTLHLHHTLTIYLSQHFTTCLPFLFHNFYTMRSPCMFIRITSPYAHHVYNNHFTIYSPCMFTIITSPYAHHVYNNHFTVCSPCMFIMYPSPFVKHDLFTMYVYHKYFTAC